MDWFKRSIKNQTIFLTSSIGLVVIAAVLAISMSLRNSSLETVAASAQELQMATDVASMHADFKRMVQEWKNVLLRGHDPSDRVKYWSRIAPLINELTQKANMLSSKVSPHIAMKFKQFTSELEKVHRAYRKAYSEFENTLDHKAIDRLVRGIDRTAGKILEETTELIKRQQKKSAERLAKASLAHFQLLMTVTVILIVVSAASLTLLVIKKIVQPLTELSQFSQKIARGEFNHKLNIRRNDEIGILADILKRMSAFLATTYQQLDESNRKLISLSDKQYELAESLKSISEQQFTRTDQVATAVTEMSASAQEVATAAKRAAEATSQANRSAKSGHDIMRQTITTIEQVAATIEHTSGVIQKLEQDATAVSTVLEVIRGIAEQTNLLALNAAIEAARAGEQGRGFAVVADEVRTLAQRTQESTQEIEQILEAVQSGAQDAVKAIASAKNASFEGVGQVEAAGEKIEDITHGIETISEMNDQIATAAYQQSRVSEDLSKNINEISDVAGENVSLSEEARKASESLRNVSSELSDIVHKLISDNRS